MIRARLSPLPYLALVALLALAPLGCGGGAGGGVAMQTAATGEALSFAFTPVEPMRFSVDFSSESEFHGTAYIASIRYSWSARDWKQEGEAWTCDVTFSDIKAAMRSGSGIGMEPIEGFDQLEGFTTRYRKDGKGFEPVLEPARDGEFMGMFRQLQAGLAPLDFKTPPSPVSVASTTAKSDSRAAMPSVSATSAPTSSPSPNATIWSSSVRASRIDPAASFATRFTAASSATTPSASRMRRTAFATTLWGMSRKS